MKYKIFTLAIIAAFTTTTQAKCSSSKNTIFACTTTKGKYVEVCDIGANISYSYGKAGITPELALQVQRERVTTNQWDGSGRYINYSVNIPNGNTIYSVFFGADRVDENHAIEAGINVGAGNKTIASIKCAPNGVINNMESVNLTKVN